MASIYSVIMNLQFNLYTFSDICNCQWHGAIFYGLRLFSQITPFCLFALWFFLFDGCHVLHPVINVSKLVDFGLFQYRLYHTLSVRSTWKNLSSTRIISSSFLFCVEVGSLLG